MLEIAIFAREYNNKLAKLLNDISQQNFTGKCEVFLYIDNSTSVKGEVGSVKLNIIETAGKNVSEKRNMAIDNCKNDYLLMLDDDNRLFASMKGTYDFLSKLMEQYNQLLKKEGDKIILSPTIHWRQTYKIQSAGIDKFNYFLSQVKPMKNIPEDIEYRPVELVGGNSLFGKIETFRLAKFDTEIGYVREDLDYVASLGEKGVFILMSQIPIYHMERDKTFLENSFIKDFPSLKRKIRNRNRFVSKHGNILEKIMFYSFGYWVQILYYLAVMGFFQLVGRVKGEGGN